MVDGRRVRDTAHELLEQCGAGFPAGLAASRMADLLGGDVATVIECDLALATARRLGYAPARLPGRLVADPYGYLISHPAARPQRFRANLLPVRVSDVVEPRVWRRSRPYAELWGTMRMRHELIVPLAVSARTYAVLGILRASRDFDESAREVAARLQPVLIGMYALAAHQRPLFAGLTPRELDVLRVVSRGLTTASTARRLGISAHTAARHIEAIYAKLGTHDRATTALRAQELGLLDA